MGTLPETRRAAACCESSGECTLGRCGVSPSRFCDATARALCVGSFVGMADASMCRPLAESPDGGSMLAPAPRAHPLRHTDSAFRAASTQCDRRMVACLCPLQVGCPCSELRRLAELEHADRDRAAVQPFRRGSARRRPHRLRSAALRRRLSVGLGGVRLCRSIWSRSHSSA